MMDDRERVFRAVGRFPLGIATARLAEVTGLPRDRCRSLANELVEAGRLQKCRIQVVRHFVNGFRIPGETSEPAPKVGKRELEHAVFDLQPDAPDLRDVDRITAGGRDEI